jgi:hypothetical protein
VPVVYPSVPDKNLAHHLTAGALVLAKYAPENRLAVFLVIASADRKSSFLNPWVILRSSGTAE